MKITFQNSPETFHENNRMTGQQQAAKQSVADFRTSGAFQAYKLDMGAKEGDRWFAGAGEGKGLSQAQLQQLSGGMDLGVQQDYMTLMSNIMSPEDYGKLQEEGFPIRQMEPEEAVTIVDKIKAEVAKSGKQIAGYNDDLDMDTLARALGSQILAQAISSSFSMQDVPLTEDMATEIKNAWDMASKLEAPTDGAYQYMVKMGLEATVSGFYVAQSSGAGVGNRSGAMFYAEDVQGYYTQAANETEHPEELQAQVDHVIEQAGLEPNDFNRESAAWVLEHNLPLTAENLEKYQELASVEFPVTPETFADAVAKAAMEGKSPMQGDLAHAKEENLYRRANQLMEEYAEGEKQDKAMRSLEDRRILEEIRLCMTSEVNIKLLRSGFSIDTAPMEELVEAIRAAQQEIARNYFPGDEQAVSKYQMFHQTNTVMEELPGMPAKLLGVMKVSGFEMAAADMMELTNLSETYRAGKDMEKSLREAGQSYETLMTAPRADMGDTIRKAFRNVDAILSDMGYEPTEENRKAVRVLGYNQMEVTDENLRRVVEAQHQVNSVVAKMTPASVLDVIRAGVNPLESSFEELNTFLDQRQVPYEQQAESYSHFLYRLERNGQLTQEERESFIGIYRLLHQVEKQDGAAVGGVLNTGAELDFSTLLAAARSGRFGGLDAKIGDEKTFAEYAKAENAIDQQIEKAYVWQELEEIRQAAQAGQDARALLERGQVNASVDHLLAAKELEQDPEAPFVKAEKLRRDEESNRDVQGGLEGLWEALETPEEFQKEYAQALQKMDEKAREDTWAAQSSLDVKGMKILHTQLAIAQKLGQAQEYYLPMEIDGKQARIHLTLEHGGQRRGQVVIELAQENGMSKATLQLKNNKVTGFLQGSSPEEVMKCKQASDIFSEYLKDESSWSMDAALPTVDMDKTIDLTGAAVRGKSTVEKLFDHAENAAEESGLPSQTDLYRLAKLWIRAVTKKG